MVVAAAAYLESNIRVDYFIFLPFLCRSRNGRLDIEISSATADAKCRKAAAAALSIARAMLIKRLSNSDAGVFHSEWFI
jgi:hypothetical protein